MNQRFILAALAALAFICIATTAFAQTTSTKVPISGTYYNPCCDEYIYFSGTGHVVTTTTTNSDGTETTTYRFNASGITGTGLTSGISYNIMENGSQSETITPSLPYPKGTTATVTATDRLVGKGRGGHECSATIKITAHVEVDEDGNLVVYDYNIEFICANGTTIS